MYLVVSVMFFLIGLMVLVEVEAAAADLLHPVATSRHRRPMFHHRPMVMDQRM